MKTITIECATELQEGLLTAAVTDFFHKMRASEEDPLITWVKDDRYRATKNLWDQVEAQTNVAKWSTEDE